MQPRTLQSVLAELDSVYAPQIENVRKKQASLPGQVQAEEAGLQAKQTQAYGDIVDGARRRGLGFSGIPLGEQARYSATEYMPALARLKQSARDQAMSLEDAILGIQERRMNQGQSIYENERTFAEQVRQYNETLAETKRQNDLAAGANQWQPTHIPPNLSNGNTAQGFAQQREDKGFNFTDMTGRPISAAAYAQATGTPFREVLQRMAQAGDAGAQRALGFVGNDFGYDPRKVTDKATAQLYNNLVWGVRPQAAPASIRLANNPRY